MDTNSRAMRLILSNLSPESIEKLKEPGTKAVFFESWYTPVSVFHTEKHGEATLAVKIIPPFAGMCCRRGPDLYVLPVSTLLKEWADRKAAGHPIMQSEDVSIMQMQS